MNAPNLFRPCRGFSCLTAFTPTACAKGIYTSWNSLFWSHLLYAADQNADEMEAILSEKLYPAAWADRTGCVLPEETIYFPAFRTSNTLEKDV
jgi:hypothetical protein